MAFCNFGHLNRRNGTQIHAGEQRERIGEMNMFQHVQCVTYENGYVTKKSQSFRVVGMI